MRRIRALVLGLPRGSAVLRSLDPERSRWDTTAELLATLIEVVDMGNLMFHKLHFKPPLPDPVVITRPGRAEEEEQVVSMSSPEARSFFGGGQVMFTPPSESVNG